MDPNTGFILGLVGLGVLGALIFTVSSLIVMCQPNEMVVITGRKRITADGRRAGYRLLHGGRTLRVPIIERVSRIDLTTLPIEVVVKNAYSKGGIPLIVHGIADTRLRIRGFGEEKPVATNENADGRQQNRRVEIVIERS